MYKLLLFLGHLISLILVLSSLIQDLLTWTKDKSEVEIVDLILKLREKLVSET